MDETSINHYRSTGFSSKEIPFADVHLYSVLDSKPGKFRTCVTSLIDGLWDLFGSGNYRKLPKAGLKIEYRPNVSGVVGNLELGPG